MLPERYVDAVVAAEFLSLKPRRILDLARSGLVPGHPLGNGTRRVWRFRLSELEAALSPSGANSSAPTDSRAKSTQQSVSDSDRS